MPTHRYGHHPAGITIAVIQKKVADHYRIGLADMMSGRRTRTVVRPRQMAMCLARQLTTNSFPGIALKFGGRDHTTVIHAVRTIERLASLNPDLHSDMEQLRGLLLAEQPGTLSVAEAVS